MTAQQFVLWGYKPSYCPLGLPIKLTGGTLREVNSARRSYTAEGFMCATYKPGAEPVGLRMQVADWLERAS
jgi:hypothetical protein